MLSPALASDLAAAFAAGLFSSVHCVGMCGPLASLGCRANIARRSSLSPFLFVIGKLASYSLLGLVAGLVGAAFLGVNSFGRTLAVLTLGGGLLMLVILFLTHLKLTSRHLTRLSAALAKLSLQTGSASPALLGVAAAFLPCGLLYAMVARSAAAGAPLISMSLMQAFGLGTSPALLGAGALLRFVPRRWNRFGTAAAEVVLALSALVLIWRGAAGLLMTPAHPSCCP